MEDNLKFRPSVKEKVLGIFKAKEEPKRPHLEPHQYESGLEVVHPLPWNPNDVPLPEVSPYPHLDARTLSTPQVADDPASWHHYHLKKNPGLEVAAAGPTSSSSVMSPGGYSSTLYGGSQDGTQQLHPAGYHRPTTSESKSVDGFGMGPRVCGMRRKVFYIVMAVAIIFVVAAIAIGLGAGLAFGRKPAGDKSSGSGSLPSGVESTKTANISCPASDNSTFSAQAEPDRLFRLICGHDYNSEDGAIDLTSENATTMANCIDRCANRTECVGAGWGDYYGNHVCWMKSRLGKPNVSGNWLFAVDLNGTDASKLP
ncbi:hypothetical protein CkaCkLH20_05005 [Colletotrichum karsti]|uniref:Apple domain-containing protein n=1 Tax=Colletotrichum karsti TaxID=1095194 RepID=A0A9P6LLJ5_9PEZI|nr:uncharacterized protein CkaCkLH20_05005 [Colletotrichum karsti]KAF9877305.1 hypothetical protein CkaCkLH20_05005 [Colletotrichum karsti]